MCRYIKEQSFDSYMRIYHYSLATPAKEIECNNQNQLSSDYITYANDWVILSLRIMISAGVLDAPLEASSLKNKIKNPIVIVNKGRQINIKADPLNHSFLNYIMDSRVSSVLRALLKRRPVEYFKLQDKLLGLSYEESNKFFEDSLDLKEIKKLSDAKNILPQVSSPIFVAGMRSLSSVSSAVMGSGASERVDPYIKYSAYYKIENKIKLQEQALNSVKNLGNIDIYNMLSHWRSQGMMSGADELSMSRAAIFDYYTRIKGWSVQEQITEGDRYLSEYWKDEMALNKIEQVNDSHEGSPASLD